MLLLTALELARWEMARYLSFLLITQCVSGPGRMAITLYKERLKTGKGGKKSKARIMKKAKSMFSRWLRSTM
jgi:hypothetical protein